MSADTSYGCTSKFKVCYVLGKCIVSAVCCNEIILLHPRAGGGRRPVNAAERVGGVDKARQVAALVFSAVREPQESMQGRGDQVQDLHLTAQVGPLGPAG